MNRVIKFRAWDGETMIEGHSFCINANGSVSHLLYTGKWVDDHSLLLMQFIGLLDKNGKEIYEGDIVRIMLANSIIIAPVVFGIHSIGKDDWGIEHVSPCFCLKFNDGSGYSGLNLMDSYEVIGNIHEHKHLL